MTAVMDRSVLQQVVFECVKEMGDTIKSSCSNQGEYKQVTSMTTGDSLSLDHLLLSLFPIPSIHISWRTEKVDSMEQVDVTRILAVLTSFLNSVNGIWIHRRDTFDAMIQDDNHQDSHSTLTNEKLSPTPSGVKWRCVGDKQPNGLEIENEEFSESVGNTVMENSFISSLKC